MLSRPHYPFLAHPPPQKKRPVHPLPPPPSSPARNAFSSIATWAARVQPGSPSPRSPRRPSVASIRVPPPSFLHIAPTPTTAHMSTTPSMRDFKADLTTVGYTSVFLQLPHTPVSAMVTVPLKPPSPDPAEAIPIPPVPSPTHRHPGLTRFRSLSALRSRGRSKPTCPNSPTKMQAKAAAASLTAAKRKKAKYTMRPAPLANELALMQFADGGTMDDNIKRTMQAHKKAAGAVGRADVFRAGNGAFWWDQDEEWEYARLLADSDELRSHLAGDVQWVTFDGCTSPSRAEVHVSREDHRMSLSTQDSDLDPNFIVQPIDVLDADDLALFGGGAIAPLATRKPGMSVLALPSRPRRAAKHLRKPDYLVDMAFAQFPTSPKSPKFSTQAVASGGISKPRGKARRRPAPLKLVPPSPAFKLPTNSPIDSDKVRQDFIEASFRPAVSAPVTPAVARVPLGNGQPLNGGLNLHLGIKKKPSMLNMMGLFRSGRKEDVIPSN